MASGSNPRRTLQRVQDDDRVDPSTPQRNTPSNTRLANLPKQAVEEAANDLRSIISPKEHDTLILNRLNHVCRAVKEVLEQDPKLKKYLASKEEFRDNVTKKGEKKFIDSLRTMATNSDTQGSDAWKDLLEDGTSFSFSASIVLIVLSVQTSFSGKFRRHLLVLYTRPLRPTRMVRNDFQASPRFFDHVRLQPSNSRGNEISRAQPQIYYFELFRITSIRKETLIQDKLPLLILLAPESLGWSINLRRRL